MDSVAKEGGCSIYEHLSPLFLNKEFCVYKLCH